MRKLYFVGLCSDGYGAGKSTVAEYLETAFANMGITVLRVPFAVDLKDTAKYMGWDGEKDEKGRKLLQLLGTDCGRNCIHDCIWIAKWFNNLWIQMTPDKDYLIIADDVRFANEQRFIKGFNGIIVNIHGRGTPSKHASETSKDPTLYDYEINNDGTLEELYSFVCHNFVPFILEHGSFPNLED